MNEHMNHGAGADGGPTLFALWSPGTLLLAVIAGFAYFYYVNSLARQQPDVYKTTSRQKTAFVFGLIVFYAGQGSPISYYGQSSLFSAHMLQQSLLYLIMPPLLYLGIPEWMAKPVLDKRFVRKWLQPLTNPMLSVLLFNLCFSIYHIPFIMNNVHHNGFWHYGTHVLLIVLAFHMWFPVFAPVKEWDRLSDLQKLAYVFANGVLLTPACALIIFSKTIMYPMFAQGPQVFELLPPLDDQQLGGTLMKIIQEIVYGTVLAFVFFRWFRRERAKDDDLDAIPGEAWLQKNGG
ncbi:cytochrome c oxidase assembly protein [Paenibacillus cymbidii]|uniref:cytochrome c oxidase assembly protein n=1 Tax=Paenibacillus cymbidii TaxID=1639034 RepID=UPI001F351841|nr:cytochrome c oxidase assembly protein [Paenibacillus cymbidii]